VIVVSIDSYWIWCNFNDIKFRVVK
jgi:hypothetical protein